MVTRRVFCSGGAWAVSAGLGLGGGSAAGAATHASTVQARLQALEVEAQGRLGVFAVDTATGQSVAYRADERFMMLSSFKLLASALVLHRVDRGQESLARRVVYGPSDLVTYSPVTEQHADGSGMTLGALCHATLTTSDNTAANLILDSYGGPAALTAFARQLGDGVTRLDRREPALNVPTARAGLDTTTPRAMASTLQQLALGAALSPASRQQLQQWLLANTTGGQRLKAALPPGWRCGDKTGTNATDSNDIGLLWPPARPPWVVAAYLADSRATPAVRDQTLARVGQLVSALAG